MQELLMGLGAAVEEKGIKNETISALDKKEATAMLVAGLPCARLRYLIMLAWGAHDYMAALGLSPVARWGLIQRFRAAAAETSHIPSFLLSSDLQPDSWYVGSRQIL